MISASKLDAILEELKTAIPGIVSQRSVVTEEHFAKLISDMYANDFPCLLGVIPDVRISSRSLDNQKFSNKMMFFILQKVDEKDRTPELTIEVYTEMAKLVEAVKNYIYAASSAAPCYILSQIEWDTVDILPEYNFASCDGYSLAFSMDTNKLEL